MNKENILFGIVGLLLGLIVGFMFANNVNQKGGTASAPSAMAQNSNMPPGHPEIPGATPPSAATMAQVQAAVEKAKASPDDFDAQVSVAEMYYGIQKFTEAAEYLKNANKLRPDDYSTIVNLGNALFDGGSYEEAGKWYSAALEKKPDEVNVRTDLGLTFMFKQSPDYDRALQEFEKSIAKDPAHVPTLQNMAVAYTKKNDAAKAKATLARLEQVDPKNEAIAKLQEEINKLGK